MLSTVHVCLQIRPQEMSEGCFWVLADEDQYAKPELLTRVALNFGSQRTGQTHYFFIYLCCTSVCSCEKLAVCLY